MPAHARGWIDALYEKAHGSLLVEAFAGSTKTTTFVTFMAYQIGLKPERGNMLIQVSDESAAANAARIAQIIQHNDIWKACFPYVVPDPETGWGAMGYFVKRADVPYGDWTRTVADRSGPSFVGYGRTARGILGKHPDGVLLIDDIDDENTTSSDREQRKTQDLLQGTIFPRRTPTTITVVIGTPWTVKDTIAYVKSTEMFHVVRTPILLDGVPLWLDKYPPEEIDKLRKLSGELLFARAYLLDLEAAKGLNLKKEWLHEYPYEDISPSWPVVMGVDYASTADKMIKKEKDYFAISIGRLLPGGGVVLVDGYRGQVSQGEAEHLVRSWAGMYPTTVLVIVEAVGKGEEFYHLLLRNSRLPIFPATTGGKSKGNRFEKQMQPLFEFSRVWVSDKKTEFLQAFEDEWVSWPLGRHDDTLDATYYMILGATQLGNLAPPAEMAALPAWFASRKKEPSPWSHFGRR